MDPRSAAGAGDTVLLVHGSTASARQWARLTVLLEGEHRVVAPDLIGYGDNTTTFADDFHFDADVELLRALIARASSPVHLVGHSYGGLLALHAALRDPARVRSITVYEPVVFGVLRSSGDAPEAVAELDALDRDGMFRVAQGGGYDDWLRLFVDYWNGKGAFDALGPERRRAMGATARKAFLEVRSLVGDPTPHTAFARITAPTLVLRGTQSPVTARETARVLAEAMPRATLVTFEGVGHMAPVLSPGLVNPRIAAHIAQIAQPSRGAGLAATAC